MIDVFKKRKVFAFCIKMVHLCKLLRCLLNKKDRCIELYYESNEYNIIYCHGRIYKILGDIPNEILEAQLLLSDIGESSDYESFNSIFRDKKEKIELNKLIRISIKLYK